MIKLCLQMFGGRGSNYRIPGMPKNKRKSINSYNKRIEEHKIKISNAKKGISGYNKRDIEHWEKEIKTFKTNIEKIERRYKK